MFSLACIPGFQPRPAFSIPRQIHVPSTVMGQENSKSVSIDGESRVENAYLYRKLEHDLEFRLLHLMPGEGHGELQCELIHRRLDGWITGYPTFTAISYTWGSPNDKRRTRCGDGYVMIPSNLYAALDQLRQEDKHYWLWADAVCIDQGNFEERAAQVRIMRRIFAEADLVWVWLGLGDDVSRGACHLMRKICKHPAVESWYQDIKPTIELHLSEEEWLGIDNFFMRSYFRRVWVFQEIALAQNIEFHLGQEMLSFAEIRSALVAYLLEGSVSIMSMDCRHSFSTVLAWHVFRNRHRKHYRTRTNTVSERAPELLSLVTDTVNREASDPRDFIFAVLGLSREADSASDLVDYGSSIQTVFTNFALHSLLKTRTLGILSLVSKQVMCGLPSWVPDWTSKDLVTTMHFPSCETLRRKYYAGGKHVKPNIQVSDDASTLIAQGHIVAYPAVDDMAILFSTERASLRLDQAKKEMKEGTAKFMRSVFEIALRAPEEYVTGESREDALFRALVYEDDPSDPEDAKSQFLKLWDTRELDNPGSEETLKELGDMEALREAMDSNRFSRRFCLVNRTYFGWVPLGTEDGDVIVMLVGGALLYVLRPAGDGRYRLVGDCYLQGLMNGEISREGCIEISIV